MTKLLARINQIELVLSSVMDECTEADPRQLAIARTEFEKSFVWLKHVAKDVQEIPESTLVTVPFTINDEVSIDESNTPLIAPLRSVMVVYKGDTFMGTGYSRSEAISDVRQVLGNRYLSITFSFQEVTPIELIASKTDSEWTAIYEGKQYIADSVDKLRKDLSSVFPASIFYVRGGDKGITLTDPIRLEYVTPVPSIADPYGKKGHVVYLGVIYSGYSLKDILNKITNVYPNKTFIIDVGN